MLSILVNLLSVVSYYVCSYNHTDWYGDYTVPIHWNRMIGVKASTDSNIITSLCKGPIYFDPPYLASIQSVCIKNPIGYLKPKPHSFTKLSHKLHILHSFNASTRYKGIYQSMVYEPIQHMYTICLQTSYDSIFS
jgi:hypothetical protein